jgi:hypothetical protein
MEKEELSVSKTILLSVYNGFIGKTSTTNGTESKELHVFDV